MYAVESEDAGKMVKGRENKISKSLSLHCVIKTISLHFDIKIQTPNIPYVVLFCSTHYM